MFSHTRPPPSAPLLRPLLPPPPTNRLRGILSHAMVMCTKNEEGKVEVIAPPAGAVAGDLVSVNGYPRTHRHLVQMRRVAVVVSVVVSVVFFPLPVPLHGVGLRWEPPLSPGWGLLICRRVRARSCNSACSRVLRFARSFSRVFQAHPMRS